MINTALKANISEAHYAYPIAFETYSKVFHTYRAKREAV
jgi:hypothetical protein